MSLSRLDDGFLKNNKMKKTLLTFGVMSAVVCGTLAYSAMEPGILSKTGASGDDTKESNEKVGQEQKNSKVLPGNLTLNAASFELAKSKIQSDETGKPNRLPEAGENEVVVDLWGTAEHILSAINVEGYTIDQTVNTIQFPATTDQSNWIFTGATEANGGYQYAWYADGSQRYFFTGHIEATGAANVYGCIFYVNNDNNNIYISSTHQVVLDESNGFAADFRVEARGIPEGSPICAGWISAGDEGVTITASGMELYYTYKSFAAEKWTPENDLPGLGISNGGYADNCYIVKCEDGVTTLGVYYNGSLYVTGMNTTAAHVALPEHITIDGNVCNINYFGDNTDMDWSNCPNLTSLEIGSDVYVVPHFDSSTITDLYIGRGTSFNFTTGYNNIYLHIPYGVNRYDYSGCDFKRVLVGDELPTYPETEISDWVIAGETEGEYFGIKVYDGYYRIAEIFTSNESVTLPIGTPAANGNYYVRGFGLDSNLGYGTLCAHATGLKSVTVPESYTNINVSWYYNPISELHMQGDVPETRWSVDSNITVYVAEQAYYSNYENNSNWSNATLLPEGWDFEWMTINVGRKGEFAQTYIEMNGADWSLGTYVKVTGELNASDLKNMKNLTKLRKLDLSEAVFTALPDEFLSNTEGLVEVSLPEILTAIPSNAFYNCTRLLKVTAPGVTSVGRYAFYNCRNLSDFDISGVTVIDYNAFSNCWKFNPAVISSDLKTLGESAFYNTGVTEVVIPDGINKISTSAFASCHALTKVTLGANVYNIEYNAFSDCENLKEINLPENLSTIGESAFNGCRSLEEITLPSTLQSISGSAFNNCESLTSVKCKAVVPPSATNSFTNGVNMNVCTLYVAPFALDFYRDTEYWNEFFIMKPLDEPVKNIYVKRPMSFDLLSEDNAVLQGNPNMTLTFGYDNRTYTNTVGQLSATGDGTLSAGIFWIDHSVTRRDNNYNDYRPSLVNNAENMRADSVLCTMHLEKNYWHFISFQYDVQMKDIFGANGTDFVIRKYNGQNRATGDGSVSNWENVPADGVLEAGKGYIIQAANNLSDESGNSYNATVCFPSRNTVTKNKLFTSNNIIVPLEEFVSEFAHNRSWNLVGNPYPCYYDMHALQEDFYTPITLWRGRSYQAYSPIDDDIILRPNEAFFVQRPLDAEQMVFGAEGRMHYDAAMASEANPGAKAPALEASISGRSVFNFTVSGNGSDDRARIVMNDAARMDYELNRDASKFFAETAMGTEVFVSGDVNYAICERPLGDGLAKLGMRLAQRGEYTISLDGRNINGWTVILTDTETGATVNLCESAYSFDAEAGVNPDRFLLTFINPGTSIDEVNAADNSLFGQVYDASGMKVFEGEISEFKASAEAGIYIVVCNGKASKILIK